MIEGVTITERVDTLFRLASIPKTSVEAALIARGIDPSNVAATLEAIIAVGIPFNAEEVIEFSFRAQSRSSLYPIGRFGDGTCAVFYSALEVATCLEEVRYHRRNDFILLQTGVMPFQRYFTLIKCDFNGSSVDLRGHAGTYPDLVSETSAGYPFCQEVARWVQAMGAQALHTVSARRPLGTCVPVFVRNCLSNPMSLQRYRFFAQNGELLCEELPL